MPGAMLTEVTVVERGTSATTAAATGTSVLTVEDLTQFDEDTGTLDVCGIQYDWTDVDEDALTITLATPLTADVDEFDPVLIVAGDEVAKSYTAVIDMGEGDSVTIPIPLELRPLLAEGLYDPPVPIAVSPDLQSIVDVPGRVPVIRGTAIRTADGPGPRWEITSGDDPFNPNVIQGFTGDPTEDTPAVIETEDNSPGTGDLGIIVKSPAVAGGNQAYLRLYTNSIGESNAFLAADFGLIAGLFNLAGGISFNNNNGLYLHEVAFGVDSVTFPGGAGASTATKVINHGLNGTPEFFAVIPDAGSSVYTGYLAGSRGPTAQSCGIKNNVGNTVSASVSFLWIAIR